MHNKEGNQQMMKRSLAAMTLAAALLAAPVAGFAQGGGNDTPVPPGADGSARVDRITGQGPAAVGSPGNPTGRAADRPSASTRPSNMAVTPANPNSQSSPGAASTPSAHTN